MYIVVPVIYLNPVCLTTPTLYLAVLIFYILLQYSIENPSYVLLQRIQNDEFRIHWVRSLGNSAI